MAASPATSVITSPSSAFPFRRGRLSVSSKTREKVSKAAKKLGYRPNAIARMLITQRSGMVAVIISSMVNLIYPELLTRLTEELSANGVRVLLFTLDDPDGLEELLGICIC